MADLIVSGVLLLTALLCLIIIAGSARMITKYDKAWDATGWSWGVALGFIGAATTFGIGIWRLWVGLKEVL